MPLTPKQKLTIGLYVGLLTAVIFLLWLYFLKFEFKKSLSGKSEEAAWFNVVKQEVGQMASSSKDFFKQAKERLNESTSASPTTSQATSTLSGQAQRLLLDQAKQELENKK